MRLITRPGQGLGGGVDLRHPPGGSHDPLSVIDAAHIRLIDELAAAFDPGHHGAVDHGRFHLPEVGGHDAKHEHHLCDILVGPQPQGHRRGVQHIVLLRVQAVRQHTVLAPAEIGLVDDFIVSSSIVGAGGDLRQPHRLHGQGIAPVERCERSRGVVGDAGEG